MALRHVRDVHHEVPVRDRCRAYNGQPAGHRLEGRKRTEKDIKTFYESFLSSMKSHGRIFEAGILMRYNLVSGHPFTDADLAPQVMKKGLIHFLPKNIKGSEEVARIFRNSREKRARSL